MASPRSSHSAPNPAELQSHLYASFLHRKTADVALRIRGSWNAIYRLHRVVLIQAGFFQSLFTSGFLESKSKLSRGLDPNVIDIVFDDPNITRAAFEVCIARLYGGGPTLYIPPSLIPTPSQPLTPSFPPPPPSTALLSKPAPAEDPIPDGHHPATPRFLLSLFATAVFLSIPSLAAQALAGVIRTVGPNSAVRYLNFAIGRGIGPPDSERARASDGREPAVGLDGVAELLTDDDDGEHSLAPSVARKMCPSDPGRSSSAPTPTPAPGSPSPSASAESDALVQKEGPTSAMCEFDSDDNDMDDPAAPRPSYFYGAVSDKVGEAAACWLARWGADILPYEVDAAGADTAANPAANSLKAPPAVQRTRAGTAPSRISSEFVQVARRETKDAEGREREGVPVMWRRGGLNARWVRGLLSSDALFVRGERERYDMARTIVELRRREGLDEEEEREWVQLFAEGIYYANMSLDDLMAISRDVSPRTGELYVPLAVLQAAHWNQSALRHRITARPAGGANAGSPPLSPSARDKELGIALSALEAGACADRAAPHFPVPADASVRIGDSTGIEGAGAAASMDALFAASTSAAPGKAPPASEANFFGLQQQRVPAAEVADGAVQAAKWTAHPPFRFGVEFWDVDALKEKSRLHSHTVWYAGSLYNVYVQVVRKKGVQLGVYLHRQSSVDPIPASSAPSTLAFGIGSTSSTSSANHSTHGPGTGASSSSLSARADRAQRTSAPGSASLSRPPSGQYSSGGSLSRSTTPTTPATPATPLSSSLPSGVGVGPPAPAPALTLPATAPPVMPPQPYRDPRAAVSAYFAIACASATGASLTRFTSAPDVFSVSQSWGWKSSSLRTEEYLEVGPDGQPRGVDQGAMPAGREVSLRATVVLGVV